MNNNLLVELFGWRAALTHGDMMMMDRWLWLKRRLPETLDDLKLLDVGCGTGAFTIAAAKRGYKAHGLSWDTRNQAVAEERAKICGAGTASFEVQDVRLLDERRDLCGQYDYVICLECIEHILDDFRLMAAMSSCLRPGGRLLLTTPNYLYEPVTDFDKGPFRPHETGWHVRRGYSPAMLRELCEASQLSVEQVSHCSGAVSQLVMKLYRPIAAKTPAVAWGATLPLRLLPPILDQNIGKLVGKPGFSICLEAYKPRKS
jgi:2-polyprenyl-3-methyl-5-hydroxy-6-metoxy-1,4-benzoquinol methylase